MNLPNSPAYEERNNVICLTKSGWRLYDSKQFSNFIRKRLKEDKLLYDGYLPCVMHRTGDKSDYKSTHLRLLEVHKLEENLPSVWDSNNYKYNSVQWPFDSKNDYLLRSLVNCLLCINENCSNEKNIKQARYDIISTDGGITFNLKAYRKPTTYERFTKKEINELTSSIEFKVSDLKGVQLTYGSSAVVTTSKAIYKFDVQSDVITTQTL